MSLSTIVYNKFCDVFDWNYLLRKFELKITETPFPSKHESFVMPYQTKKCEVSLQYNPVHPFDSREKVVNSVESPS